MEYPHLAVRVKYKQRFYGSEMARILKGILSELLFGDIGAGIPTYVRSDNSTVVYQVDSANIATDGKRLNGFLESNRDELEQNNWMIIGYVPGVKYFR